MHLRKERENRTVRVEDGGLKCHFRWEMWVFRGKGKMRTEESS